MQKKNFPLVSLSRIVDDVGGALLAVGELFVQTGRYPVTRVAFRGVVGVRRTRRGGGLGLFICEGEKCFILIVNKKKIVRTVVRYDHAENSRTSTCNCIMEESTHTENLQHDPRRPSGFGGWGIGLAMSVGYRNILLRGDDEEAGRRFVAKRKTPRCHRVDHPVVIIIDSTREQK